MSDIVPEITILICTYNRPDELTRTITALREKVVYPAERLRWIVNDDSSPELFTKFKRNKALKDLSIQFVVTSKNSGWGVNVNNGLRAVETDYVLFIEDDYVLQKPLDLNVGVALMEAQPDLGMVRYRGTAGTHVIYHQFEADISASLPDYRDGLGLPGKLTYLQLDSGSPSLYVYSHGCHLKHRRFHEFYGLYPEGLKLALTEEAMCHQVKDKMRDAGAPAIAILPEWVPMWFEHIGQSYQGTEADQ